MRSLRVLLLVVLIFALQCVPAMAAAGDYDLTKAGEAYTLVYETADSVGTQVVLIMMAGSTLDDDGKVPINASGDIVYIDQTSVVTGDSVNEVVFDSFIPMSIAKAYYSLYLGGLTDGPVWVETLEGPKGNVSGKVEYFGAGSLILNLFDSTKTNTVDSVTVTKTAQATDAPFEFSEVRVGEYYIKSEARDYCVTEYKPVIVLAEDLAIIDIFYKVYAGDVNNNGAINVYDITALLNDFGKTEGFIYGGSDVNLNGAVNVYDISALLDGFGKNN